MHATSFARLSVMAAVIALSTVLTPGPVTAQDRAPVQAAPQAMPEAPIADRIRDILAARLKVRKADLKDGTDLVAGLQIDPTDVYYAVLEVHKALGIKTAPKELTRVGDIIAAAEAAKAMRALRKEGPKASTDASYVQTVYFATDRKATGSTKPEEAFGGERADAGRMSYGRAEVNIPYSHKRGQIETPWLEIKQLRDPKLHIYVLKVDSRDETSFFSEVAAPGPDDILLYIHGFNVTFENALQRAAQISVDFGFKGTPVVFTWPSYAGVTGYNTDWENVNWATKHIEAFIDRLASTAKGRKIHVIAHSMGNKGLLNALRLMTYRGITGPLFQSAILCAPDFDSVMFREQVAAEIKPLARQWVIYTSDNDIALMTSERLNTPRLGRPVTYAEGFEIIDATGVEVTPWSVPETHSYYAVKKVVLDDMVKVLSGAAASARGLKSKLIGADTVWTFAP